MRDGTVGKGRIVNISESGFPRPYPVFSSDARGGAELSVPAPTPPPIQPGEQEVTVQVSVAYELK